MSAPLHPIREFTDAELAALSQPQRAALVTHVSDGLCYSDVAYQLGIPIGTVRSRIHRARAKITAAREKALQEVGAS
jgi:DNA-directed RNA polymerase specialized sigma24 family protein